MIVEISVALIALAFLVFVIFAIDGIISSKKTLKAMNKVLHETKRDMDELTTESLKLIKNLNETAVSAKKSVHVIEHLIRPFSDSKSEDKRNKDYDVVSEAVETIATGMALYHKIKEGIKHYVKTR